MITRHGLGGKVKVAILSVATFTFLHFALQCSASAFAAWSNASSKNSSMAMATINKNFTPVKVGSLLGTSSGTGGTTYSSEWSGLGAVFYFNLTNTSSVQAGFTGSLTTTLSSGLMVVPQVTIYKCSTAWNTTLGTCTGSSVLTGPHGWNSVPSFEWGTLAAGATSYIAVTTGIAMANIRMTATATPWMTRAGIDRTAG